MDAKVKVSLEDPSLFRQQCYLNGEWVDADGGGTTEVNNPATGEVIGTVASAGHRRNPGAPLRRPTRLGASGAQSQAKSAPI